MLDPRVAKAYSGIDLTVQEANDLWNIIVSDCAPLPQQAQPVSAADEAPAQKPAPGEPVSDAAASAEKTDEAQAKKAASAAAAEIVFPKSKVRFEDFLPPRPEKEHEGDEPAHRSSYLRALRAASAARKSNSAPRRSGSHASGTRKGFSLKSLRNIPLPSRPVLIAAAAAVVVAIALIFVLGGKGESTDAVSTGSAVFSSGKKTEAVDTNKSSDESRGSSLLSSSRSAVVIQQADDLDKALGYEGPSWALEKINAASDAMDEWNQWLQAKRYAYFEENMPSLATFLMRDSEFDGVDVAENKDGTYTLTHWSFGEDPTSQAINPITGQLTFEITQVPDKGGAVTVGESEYLRYQLYSEEQLANYGYGEYYYIYDVNDEAEAAKLEEMSEKYSLKLRREPGTHGGYGEEDDQTLHRQLSESVADGDVFTSEPEIDHFVYFENGSFQCVADLYLMDGRRMYILMCSTHYDEMIDGRVAGGFTVSNPGTMNPRVYTAADGTEVSISQNSEQAIIYAYLDNCYVVIDMSIDPWHVRPGSETDNYLIPMQETNPVLSEADVNYILDSINFAKLK